VSALADLLANHLLTLVVFAPLFAGAAIWLADAVLAAAGTRLSDAAWKAGGLLASLVGLALAGLLWLRFDPAVGGMQLVEHAPWLPDWGIHYFLGVDGISLLLVVLTAFLLPVVLLASWSEIGQRVRFYVLFMLALQTGMLGSFLALNLIFFYVFWEAMLVPMYFIIGIWGGPRRLYATLKFFVYTMAGSLLMLVGILVLGFLHHQSFGSISFDFVGTGGGTGLLDLSITAEGGPWWARQSWLFAAFALAFAIKVPLFPFHTWLPDAHVEAPTPGSAVLAGVLLKLGTYGFLRYALPLFPQAAVAAAPWLGAIAVVGIIYGALVAMVQSDVKKLVAYSSVSHMGFVVLGLFAFNPMGLQGALVQMVNHGITTGALFILVGMLYERRHVREISEFGGIAHVMPAYAALFVIAVLGSVGLPALNGFVGELLILLGAFRADPWLAVPATAGVILAAVYLLSMVRRVFFGPVSREANRALVDLGARERLVAVALVIPMFWIGLYPTGVLAPIDRSVNDLLELLSARGALGPEALSPELEFPPLSEPVFPEIPAPDLSLTGAQR
jgi:NADH-quinone oxidoreductase subunit M